MTAHRLLPGTAVAPDGQRAAAWCACGELRTARTVAGAEALVLLHADGRNQARAEAAAAAAGAFDPELPAAAP